MAENALPDDAAVSAAAEKVFPRTRFCSFGWVIFTSCFFEDAKEASGPAQPRADQAQWRSHVWDAISRRADLHCKADQGQARRVAVCDQTSEPQPGKIVSRDITQIITAGTISEMHLLEAKRANYLGAVYVQNGSFGFAYADLSTGEFRLAQVSDRQTLLNQLARVGPAELLVSEDQAEQVSGLGNVISYDGYAFFAGAKLFHALRAFQNQIARRFRLQWDAGGGGARPAALSIISSTSCGGRSIT